MPAVARSTVTEQPKTQATESKAAKPFGATKSSLRELTQRDAKQVGVVCIF